ncbi:peptidylprolyl isomerase [Belliella kenyensis]|uniref:Peptidyl-prolyl cis-trans isomerase n=1 Tax=Belliella kenyensis TaxID=1472724 RepID=A0ABV8EKX9_9BACT|nr:peptidylprolyl isomerase [Belliella kenyensis]MCH7400291.1 peptidylprolyl isomerase [Belliella kenyensis]MDN3604691.1 peptidylprolyl isomerase [Belliella kenyensis]MDN3605271.1 peptidylprolyl isomerase [Belliella kenyensis]
MKSQSQSKEAIGLIKTSQGDIFIKLFNETPKHKQSFIDLAENNYWDSLTFNRVIPNFVAQAGCPDTEQGFNDPEYLLEPEFVKGITHVYGAVGAGRDDNPEKLSATCQFYIVHNQAGLHRLDNEYTVFGQVIKGMDVVDKIVFSKRDELDFPIEPVSMEINIIYLTNSEIKKLIDS